MVNSMLNRRSKLLLQIEFGEVFSPHPQEALAKVSHVQSFGFDFEFAQAPSSIRFTKFDLGMLRRPEPPMNPAALIMFIFPLTRPWWSLPRCLASSVFQRSPT